MKQKKQAFCFYSFYKKKNPGVRRGLIVFHSGITNVMSNLKKPRSFVAYSDDGNEYGCFSR